VNDIFIYPNDPDNTFFIANDVGVFLTRNGGTNWVEVTNGMPNTVILHLDFSPATNKLRAGTHGRGVYEALIDFSGGSTQSNFSTTSGWNLLSVPVETMNMRAATLFPAASTSAYMYDPLAGYKIVDTLKMGAGYWLRFPAAVSHTLTGAPLNPIVINLRAGWNLIGGNHIPVPITAIQTSPSGIIQSPFYGYANNYSIADTIKPGRGYWVKVSAAGTMTIGVPTSDNPGTPLDMIDRRNNNRK
jgi:hypothetical protein